MPDISPKPDFRPANQSVNSDGVASPEGAPSRIQIGLAFGGVAASAIVVTGFGILFKPQIASAIPSFAMQTGQPCSACHTAFPELTPFGREFKLGGYTMGGGLTFDKAPPVSAMVVPTFTHTDRKQDTPPAPATSGNNNVVLQQASLFYGGTIYGNLGAFVQGTYDRASGHVFLDNTDIRYADTTKFFGTDLLWGIDANNNPTVQDVWNTAPAWSFPYISASLAPQFAPPATMLEGGFAGQVAGIGVYTWWKDMVYVEVSAYQSLSKGTAQALGEPDVIGSNSISGAAPYWRVAFAPTIGDHSFMIGTFGMLANEVPGRVGGFGVDQILDVGFDAQYQYINGKHAYEVKLTDITETAQFNASLLQGATSNRSDALNTFRTTLNYVYDSTYSFTFNYFNVTGSHDAVLYAGSSKGIPNSEGFIFDVAYLPLSHGGPSFLPWLNARIGMSYTKYLTLYGGSVNFDGAYHNAGDNNTFLTYMWIAF